MSSDNYYLIRRIISNPPHPDGEFVVVMGFMSDHTPLVPTAADPHFPTKLAAAKYCEAQHAEFGFYYERVEDEPLSSGLFKHETPHQRAQFGWSKGADGSIMLEIEVKPRRFYRRTRYAAIRLTEEELNTFAADLTL